MKFLAKLAMLLLALGVTASAAELAVLKNGFSIRHEHHEAMDDTTRLYFGSGSSKGWVDVPTDEIASYEPAPPEPQPAPAAGAAAQSVTVEQAVAEASDKHDIDPDLIHSVIRAESRGNPHAVSPKGAQGLMQLMPGTASDLGVQNAFDTQANVNGGTQYLHELLVQYHGDMVKALAAYNAGPKAVDRYHGVPPYRETRSYVSSVVRDFNRKKQAQGVGVAPARKNTKRARRKPPSTEATATQPRSPGL